MKKDPTQFRERFKRWKSGELVYSSGRALPEVVVTPYSSFHNELPDNLRNASESEYTMHRYWELNGKPKTFKEGVDKGMFSLQKDGWHANSVAQDEFGNYEFMKPISHPTERMELNYYFSDEGKPFRNEYKLILDPSRPGFHKYERRRIKPNKKVLLRPWVKRRFYDNVGSRWGYDDYPQAIRSFIENKKQINANSKMNDIESDTQLATYLGIPLGQRHFKNAQFKESDYKPSNYDKNKKYYSIGYLDDDEKEELINSVKGFRKSNIYDDYVYDTTNIVGSDGQELYNGKRLNFGESKTSKILSPHNLGTHTISRGVDPKRGEYVSYYDSWDINPFKGYWGERNNNFITKVFGLDKKENIDILGTPVNFYDRVYLDDFYKVRQTPEKGVYYGGYLPNVTVKPKLNTGVTR